MEGCDKRDFTFVDCTFLHVCHNENVIRFVDVKPDEGTNGTFMAKEVAFPNGIYNISMSLLM